MPRVLLKCMEFLMNYKKNMKHHRLLMLIFFFFETLKITKPSWIYLMLIKRCTWQDCWHCLINFNFRSFTTFASCYHYTCFFCSKFLYDSKLYKNNEAQIGQRNNKLGTFWGWKVRKQKTEAKMIYISFKYLLTKEWPEHRQNHLLLCNRISNRGIWLLLLKRSITIFYIPNELSVYEMNEISSSMNGIASIIKISGAIIVINKYECSTLNETHLDGMRGLV